MPYKSLLSEGRITAQTFALQALESFMVIAEAKLGDAIQPWAPGSAMPGSSACSPSHCSEAARLT